MARYETVAGDNLRVVCHIVLYKTLVEWQRQTNVANLQRLLRLVAILQPPLERVPLLTELFHQSQPAQSVQQLSIAAEDVGTRSAPIVLHSPNVPGGKSRGRSPFPSANAKADQHLSQRPAGRNVLGIVDILLQLETADASAVPFQQEPPPRPF